ncbi:MAG: beta strand repeat-containing protein, partial [Paludibacter sp.]
LAFATATSVSKNYGDAAFTNLATSSNSAGLISYESGNTGVATVNASTGEVTIVSTGSAVITARLTAAGNYTSATTTYTLNVAAKALEVTGVASTKTYDDNTSSAGTPTVGALASGDVVNLAPTQTYDNNNYGINHVLTPSGLTIKDGSDADKTANYNITYTPSPATGVINKLALTIGAATIASKVYDGSANSGTVTAGTLSGFVGSETVTVNTAIGTYPDANVGTGKSATIVYTLANGTNGGLAANYSLANGSATGTITAATLTLNNAATIFKASDYTIADLANSDLVVSAGEFNADRATNAVQSVTVAPRAKLTLNSSKTLTTGSLTLQSDATGTGTFVDENTDGGLTVTGTASVQQWLTGKTGTSTRGLWYISSPVSAATAAVFDVAFVSPNKNNMTRYDETVPGYVTQFSDNATALTPGVGYVTQIGGADAAYTFSTSTGSNTAKLNTGEVTIPVTRTGTSAGKRGFNLVGNPYPSYLDWKNAGNTKDNLRSTIWYRVYTGSTMTFDTYDGTTGTNNNNNGAVTQYIAPMQAFWVKVNADNDVATLKFVNAARSNTDITRPTNKLKAPAQKTTEPQIVRLRVSNGTNSDEAILVADANATDAFDTYDAEKMSNDNSAIPEIYTLADSQELVINHLNDFAINKQVALGFRPGTNNTFSIVANEVSNVDAQTKVILIDKLQNNTEFDLTNGTAYTFSADATPTADRFVIAFRAPGVATNLSNANNVNIFVYKNANNQITINQNSAEVGIVTVCNAIGQKLVSMPTTGTITVIRKSFGSGVYFVTVNTAGSKSTQKIIIN